MFVRRWSVFQNRVTYIYKYYLLSLVNDHLMTHALPHAVTGAIIGAAVIYFH